MSEAEVPGRNTTHDWASAVDVDHLARIRQIPTEFAPGGAVHLILEVLAYAAEDRPFPSAAAPTYDGSTVGKHAEAMGRVLATAIHRDD